MDDGPGTRYGIMNELNEKLGITNIYDDYVKMLDENSFDIIHVCAENGFHAEVCEEILSRGITARYPQGIAILEGSWTTRNTGIPNGPILYGIEGTMVVEGDDVRIYKTRSQEEPDVVYEGITLPEGRSTLGEEVVHHFDTGEPLHPTLEFWLNFDAMQVLDAGIRSAASNKLELTQDDIWTIG